jgi:hypothetical protein
VAGELEADVVDALRLGMIRTRDIAQRLQRAPVEVRAVLDSLATRGLVVLHGQLEGTPWWELTPEGHRHH